MTVDVSSLTQKKQQETHSLSILYPVHCSSLQQLKVKSCLQGPKILFVVQCWKTGVSSRGLFPLLISSSHLVCRKATKILISNFFRKKKKSNTFKSEITSENIFFDDDSIKYIDIDNTGSNGEEEEDDNDDDYTTHCHWYRRIVPIRWRPSNNRGIIVIILPPLTISQHLHPERIFTPVVVRVEHLYVQLQTLSAWFATLGGGYFLCRYLGMALQLAHKQRTIALAMGDYNMADRCTINEAYNYIYAGYFNTALRLIKSVKKSSKRRNDETTVKMCYSAKLFCRRVQHASLHEKNINKKSKTLQASTETIGVRENIDVVSKHRELQLDSKVPVQQEAPFTNSDFSTMIDYDDDDDTPQDTVDDYQRIRIVRDRTHLLKFEEGSEFGKKEVVSLAT